MNPRGGDQQTLPRPAVAPVTAARVPGVTGAELTSRFPARPLIVSWSATAAGRSAVLGRVLAPPFALDHVGSQQSRRLSVLAVMNWLQGQAGDTWQDRWRISGAENQPDWRELAVTAAANAGTGRKSLSRLSSGLLVLICADVIRPSLGWLLNSPQARRSLAVEMARTRDPAAFAELDRMCVAGALGSQVGQQALARIGVIMAAKGGAVGDVRVGDCLELLTLAAESGSRDMHARSPLFYQLLQRPRRLESGRSRSDPGVLRPRPAQLRATDRPLPHPVRSDAGRAGRLPPRTAALGGLLLAAT